jgi:phosphate transport system protein
MAKKPVSRVRSSLDRELGSIEEDLLRLGAKLDAAISRSIQALAERDVELARRIVEEDQEINQLRFQIEEACLTLIATQQPAAGDLRMVMAATNMVSDMERMADHAAGIARTVSKMADQPLLKPLIDIPRMADTCRTMVREVLEAFVARDAAKALASAAHDDTIDALYNQVFRELLSFMVEDPKTTSRALYLLFAAHNLERIGDRATNLAERVVFMISGEMKELNPEPYDSSELQ